ncbi:MAG: ATP-binding protein [Clostridia bacterium]|nr:ATP-binding protein [Clostridia bacterium]
MATYTISTLRTYLLEQKKLEVLMRANVVASIDIDTFDEYKIAQSMETMPIESGFRVIITDSQTKAYYDSFSEESYVGKLLVYESITEVLVNNKNTSSYYEKDGEWVIEAAVPIVKDQKTIGSVFVASSGEDIDEIVNHVTWAILIFGVIIIMFVFVLSVFVATLLTKPIVKLTTFIKNMPKDKLQKCEVDSSDEVGELVVAFNELIERVDELEEKRRSFVSDASHELKTPLSIIKLLSDSLIQTPHPDPQFVKEFLNDMGAEVERLTRIVQRLLDLTKMDQTSKLQIDMVSINNIVSEIYEKLMPLAENKEISFVLNKPDDDVLIPVDRDSITEAIYNIADNSIKYTENGGSVKMEIMRDLGNVLIRITDTGIGIPKEEIQKIFDRFYRVDKARARDTGGTGLGLSIAMDAVKLHNGYIEVSSEEEKGSTFTIVLPYNSDAAPPVEEIAKTENNLLTEE